tara:strand:- start:518 stop:673 length:156 start_codon:yes stop_codon:yes gene_type:complete
MSLIKTKLLEDERKKEAMDEVKVILQEYSIFSSLSPMNPPRSMNDKRYSQL